MKKVLSFIPALLLPALLVAQNPPTATPNSHASDIAKAKVAAAMARRATHVRGDALGPDDQPIVSGGDRTGGATSATRATPATHPSSGGGPATPATPAIPATPPPNSHRPDHAGQGGQGRTNNPRRP